MKVIDKSIYKTLAFVIIFFTALYLFKGDGKNIRPPPNDVKEKLQEMNKELVKFESFLGRSTKVSEDFELSEAVLKYRYSNLNDISSEQIKEKLIELGWEPTAAKSRDGDYEVFCKNLMQAQEYQIENNTYFAIYYLSGTTCYQKGYTQKDNKSSSKSSLSNPSFNRDS